MTTGWAWPPLSRKAHYFDRGMSLCHGWLYAGEPDSVQDMGEEPSRNDCRVCWKKARKLRANAAQEARP